MASERAVPSDRLAAAEQHAASERAVPSDRLAAAEHYAASEHGVSARRRLSPAVPVAVVGAIGLLIAGALFSRPDVMAVGLPLGLWAAFAVGGHRVGMATSVELVPGPNAQKGWLDEEILIDSQAEIVECALIQSERTRTRVFVPGRSRVRSHSHVLHSGPLTSVEIAVRSLDTDAAALDAPHPPVSAHRAIMPMAVHLPRMPLASRLTGLHGAHDGVRPGQGGDFRDIHPFAPGDELRRVDWKATARAARRPGDLLIRRTNTLSDVSAVIVMDTADDLGAVVATWGTRDPERSGVTSLDQARSAARSIATAVIAGGDRIAFHTLALGGRSVRSGGGSRHLARVLAEVSACGRGGDDARLRRTPPVPHGSIVYVLSTFFDGAAAEIAVRWRAAGHRVVAVDVLPELDRHRLTPERDLALEVLLVERQDMLHELDESGVEIVRWSADPGVRFAALARISGRALVRGGGR